MNDKQKKILGFIKDYIMKHGYAPTIREISKGTGATLEVACGCKDFLKKIGEIETDEEKSSPRAYRVKGMKITFK